MQTSFGHALGNTVMPIFLMLLNHFDEDRLPADLRLLFAHNSWSGMVLPEVLKATLTRNTHLFPVWLAGIHRSGAAGACFRYVP
jgi:hypothetical protein